MLTPKKGTGPATGKTKPSRRDLLMAATHALAVEQIPTEDTMTAIHGQDVGDDTDVGIAGRDAGAETGAATPEARTATDRPSPSAEPHASGQSGQPQSADSRRDPAMHLDQVRILAVRPSPFQPKGRPSAAAVSAVRQAIIDAGSLDALVSKEGTRLFARLDPEAARLAELAYDVQQHGVKTPVEVRQAEDGALECLAGHRRLAAAMLAGLETVPALNVGTISSAAAAATVLRGNLHRENFTTWQEAVLVSEVQERRKADGHQDTVRTLGQVMGWSHGKTNMLLRIRRALPAELLAKVTDDEPGGGSGVALIEERLSRTPYRDLERLANEPDDRKRLAAIRRLLGLHDGAKVSPRTQSAYLHRPKRGGGFLIEVNAPVEALSTTDAMALREVLEAQLGRVDARLKALSHGR